MEQNILEPIKTKLFIVFILLPFLFETKRQTTNQLYAQQTQTGEFCYVEERAMCVQWDTVQTVHAQTCDYTGGRLSKGRCPSENIFGICIKDNSQQILYLKRSGNARRSDQAHCEGQGFRWIAKVNCYLVGSGSERCQPSGF